MILDISHTTTYQFNEASNHGLQQIRLTPQTYEGQIVKSWDLVFDGGQLEASFTDQNQNSVNLISLDAGSKQLSVTAKGQVELRNMNGITGPHSGYAPLWLFLRDTPLTRAGKGVKKLSKTLKTDDGNDLEKLHQLSHDIGQCVKYISGRTDSTTTVEDALKSGAGVCQDHSHIFISAARNAGYPARYVSGYLMMNDRVEQDATHAWAEVYIPYLGWTGFDVSNQISPDERYVRIAYGLDYSEAAPILGITFGECTEAIFVNVQVQQ